MGEDTTLPNRRISESTPYRGIYYLFGYQHNFGGRGFESGSSQNFVFFLFFFSTSMQ